MPRRVPRLRAHVTAALLVLASIIAGWEGVSRWDAHSDAVDSWGLEAHHTAVEVAAAVTDTVQGIEYELEMMLLPASADMLSGRRAEAQTLSRYHQAMLRLDQIRFIAVFDAAGALVASTDPALRRRRVVARGRDFLLHHEKGDGGLFVTASTLTGPELERTPPPLRILLTRRVNAADGRFAGVLVVGLAPDYLLQGLLDPAVFSRKDVRLFHLDGRLLATHREGVGRIGDSYADHALFREVATQGASRWGAMPDPFDDSPEIAALQKVTDLPLVVSVMTTNGPRLAGWWHEMAFFLGSAALCLTGGAVFLLRGVLAHEDRRFPAERQDGE